MELHLGTFQGYNNEVVIAGSDAVIGHYPGINESEPIGPGAGTTGGKIALPAGWFTVGRRQTARLPAVPEEHVLSSSTGTKTAPSSGAEQQQRRKQVAAHEEK